MPEDLDPDAITAVLTVGEIEVAGRLSDASNLTLMASATLDGVEVMCVYKPIRGERPLWDFPDGTLAWREIAARRVAVAAGWDCVPITVLRPGPFGDGMVQAWVDVPDSVPALVDLLPARRVPPGWLPVLQAVDRRGADIAVAHADDPALAVLAGFDLVVNNADRKGAHLLTPTTDRVLGCDHGLCFHTEDKLRTILWGWAGKPLPDEVTEGLDRLSTGLRADLGTELEELLTRAEVAAFARRVRRFQQRPEFPEPPRNRTPIPWPPL